MNVSSRQKGFLLPTLTSVTVILLILATALLSSGTSSLRVATHDQQSDQALFAAEAGLVHATAEYAKGGKLASPYKKELENSGCRYEVTITENIEGANPIVPGGPTIPTKTVYFLSRGYSENGTYRETAALFEYGMEAFTVGALGDQLEITDSVFDAYDSAKGEYSPDATENNLPLLATNTAVGEPIKLRGTTNIRGDVFVGPTGNENQVAPDPTASHGSIHPLNDIIDIEDVEVPVDENEDGSKDISIPSIGDFRLINVESDGTLHFDDGHGLKVSINPAEFASVDTSNPSQVANAIQSNSEIIYGTDYSDGKAIPWVQIQRPSPSGNQWVLLKSSGDNPGDSSGFYFRSGDPNNPAVNPHVPVTLGDSSASSLAHRIFNNEWGELSGAPKNLHNPSSIEPGHYDSITINGTHSKLAKSGVYVVKNLNITEGNSLELRDDFDVTIYVTESMSVDGRDTLVNKTRRPKNMKIYYTGEQDVNLQGGSQSYYSLVAKKAKVALRSFGDPTHFYGALVGKSVEVTNAMFHFDTDTKGIGTGTRGTGILLMNRHRL